MEQRVYEWQAEGVLVRIVNPPEEKRKSCREMQEMMEELAHLAKFRHGKRLREYSVEYDADGLPTVTVRLDSVSVSDPLSED